jgi:hypothetical protein
LIAALEALRHPKAMVSWPGFPASMEKQVSRLRRAIRYAGHPASLKMTGLF